MLQIKTSSHCTAVLKPIQHLQLLNKLEREKVFLKKEYLYSKIYVISPSGNLIFTYRLRVFIKQDIWSLSFEKDASRIYVEKDRSSRQFSYMVYMQCLLYSIKFYLLHENCGYISL